MLCPGDLLPRANTLEHNGWFQPKIVALRAEIEKLFKSKLNFEIGVLKIDQKYFEKMLDLFKNYTILNA